MGDIVYEFQTAVRGYHYRKYWNPICNRLLYCSHEVGNHFDPFAIKVCKDDGEIVGDLPMEISRSTTFLIDRGFTATISLSSTHYRRSPLVQGGLGIPCKMVITMDIRTKRQQEVLDRYKELVNNFYFEPPDGEDIVGSFVVKEQEVLPSQCVAKKRKSDGAGNRNSKVESGANDDIRHFFTSRRKITSSKRSDVNVIELD